MRTSRIPKNLHYLTDKLPKSNYEGENENQNHSFTLGNSPHQIKNNLSTRANSKGNLPKIGQILRGNKNYSIPHKRGRNSKGDLLMI